MANEAKITPEVAAVLARWAGLRQTKSPDRLAETFDGVRQLVDRLYEVDVQGFEADFLQPDARAR